jgi:hypothetical protein
MTSRFRNELTSVPSVLIKVNRKGLSTTVGWNSGATGTPAQPGLLLRQIGDPRLSGPLPTDRFLIPGTRKDFGDGSIENMTSPGLSGFKDLLIATKAREQEINSELKKAKWQLSLARFTRALGWASLASVAVPALRHRANAVVATRQSEISTLTSNLAAPRISVNFNTETEIAEPYRKTQESFDRLAASNRVLWKTSRD